MIETPVLRHLGDFGERLRDFLDERAADRGAQRDALAADVDRQREALAALDRRLVAFNGAADTAADGEDPDVLAGALAAVARVEAEIKSARAGLVGAEARLDEYATEPDVDRAAESFARLQDVIAGRLGASETIGALNATLRDLVERCEIMVAYGEAYMYFTLSREIVPLDADRDGFALADHRYVVPLDDDPGELPAWLGTNSPAPDDDGSEITEPLTFV